MLDRPEGDKVEDRITVDAFFDKITARGIPPICDFHTTEYRSRVRIKARICLSRLGGELYAPRAW